MALTCPIGLDVIELQKQLVEITAAVGLLDGRMVEHLNCFQDTSAIAKLSKDLRFQGVNFFARRGINESYVSASPNAS